MKKVKILLVTSLILCAYLTMAQGTYYVLQSKGTIKTKKNGAVLKSNDQISDKDAIVFGSASDALLVISTKNGRMVLKPKPNAKANELVCIVSEIINPGTGRLSTRKGKLLNALDVKKFFGEDTLCVLGSMNVWVSPVAFPMNNDNFFFVRYTWNGQTINKKLSFTKDSLLISAAEIFKIDGNAINGSEVQSMKLFYKQSAGATELTEFNVIFPDEAELRESVTVLKNISQKNGGKKEDLLLDIAAFLKDSYGGKTDKDNIEDWLGKNIR